MKFIKLKQNIKNKQKQKASKNNSGAAIILITVITGMLCFILVSSLQNQIINFSKDLIKARVKSETNFITESIGLKIKEAYLLAAKPPDGLTQSHFAVSINPSSWATLSANLVNIQLANKPVGTFVQLYAPGGQICFKRPRNISFRSNEQICVVISNNDFLVKSDADYISTEEYYAMIKSGIINLFSGSVAHAQSAFPANDPGNSQLAALAAFTYNFDAANVNFNENYANQNCDPLSGKDCIKFRICMLRSLADCAAGVGNERYIVQTIVLTRPPKTTLGY